MSPEDREERDIQRGAAARRELRELDEAFAQVRQAMLEEIAKSSPDHVNKRERLYMGVQSLALVKQVLVQVASAGATAEHARTTREALATSGLTRP